MQANYELVGINKRKVRGFMAYLDHIDPGNSGGSVPTPDSPFTNIKRKPIVYECPFCKEIFATDVDRRQHKITHHPVKRPYLYVKESSPVASELVIRFPLANGDISFEDTDWVEVDNRKFFDLSKAAKHLVENQSGAVNITIGHQSYRVDYRFIFDIADETALDEIDSIFYDVFSSSIPLAKQLELFSDKVRLVEGNGLSYAGGLGCYITGVMAKDRVAEVAIPFSDYVEKLGEAQNKLQGVPRPLANSILAIAAFMLNDFGEYEGDSNVPQLGATKKFLQFEKFKVLISNDQGDKKIPIDNITEKIIRFCSSPENYRNAEISSLEYLCEASSTSSKDRLKISLTLYRSARASGQRNLTEKYRKKLLNSSLAEYVSKIAEGSE